MSLEESDILRTTAPHGHSAEVQIELFMAGQRFPVAQVGGGRLIFDQPVTLPAAEGQLLITIDGHPHRWSVILRNGSHSSRVVEADLARLSDESFGKYALYAILSGEAGGVRSFQ